MVGHSTLGVLGGMVLERDGARRSVGGPKAQVLLAVLAAHHGRPVSTDCLVEALWSDAPPPTAVAIVQSHVSRLRSALGPDLEVRRDPGGYRLEAPDAAIDAVRFGALLGRSRATGPDGSAELLTEAIELWRGPAFGDHAGLDQVRAEAVRLDELRLVALDEWAAARIAAGDAASMVGELEALVDVHPLRERFWVLLMLALHRTGRQAEALRRAQELREMLGREVGLDVSHAVRELEARILADDGDLQPDPRTVGIASERPGRRAATTLSVSRLLGSTSFVGREPDVADLVAALRSHRLVTVTGPGGVGKTRLAMRSAAEFAGDDTTVAVVEFAPVREPSGVPRVIAHALDIQQRQFRTLEETIEEYLAPRRTLLLLDNCEHVTEAVAPLVDRLRSTCDRLTVLATSRQPLGLAAEYVVVVPPLSLPPAGESSAEAASGSAAVELFVARASAASPGFTLTDDNVGAVAAICQRLDGLPLGVELAAARLRAMGIDALADRLGKRVQSLGQLQRGGDGRLRTLAELVRWSHDLLDPVAQQVFAQLAVFAGGFDLDAAEAICEVDRGGRGTAPDTGDVLAALVEQSMVLLVDPSTPRYRLLEPLREFAFDRLVEDGTLGAVEDLHLRWFHGVACRGAIDLDTSDEPEWSERLDRDLGNLRAAHHRAVASGDVDRAVEIVVALREFGFRRVQYEVTDWAEEVAALPGVTGHAEHATVLAMCGYRRWVRGDLSGAIDLAHQALGTDRTDSYSSSGLPERVLGNAHFYLGHLEVALGWMDRMLGSAVTADDLPRQAHGLYMISVARTSVGDNVRGAIIAGEARAAAARVGSPTALAQADYALGLALEGSEQLEALRHLERSARLAGAAGNRWIEAFSLTEVHWLRARRGEHLAGLAGFADVVRTWYRGGDWANQWLSLRHVFGILIDLGAFDEAAVLHGALTAVGASHALPFEPTDAVRLADVVDDLRSLLGATAFAEAVRRGASMSDGEIVEFAIGHIETLTAGVVAPKAPCA